MNTRTLVRLSAYFLFLAFTATAEVPRGWVAHGHHIANHEVGVDRTIAHSGKASAYIRSTTTDESGFRTIMQTVEVGKFSGKRVRLSGFLKTREANYAGVWMRVEGRPPTILAFDNMQARPVGGTTDWQQYEVVLDVPQGAKAVAFGFFLGGRGQVWADDFRLETVGPDVPTTGLEPAILEKMNSPQRLPRSLQWGEGLPPQSAEPLNLDFEN
jgi:hypothetical protein